MLLPIEMMSYEQIFREHKDNFELLIHNLKRVWQFLRHN